MMRDRTPPVRETPPLSRLGLTLTDEVLVHNTLTEEFRLPRVDVHVHLAVDPDWAREDKDSVMRLATLLSTDPYAYDMHWIAGKVFALNELKAVQGIGIVEGPDIWRIVRHFIWNGGYENLLPALGAAAWGGDSQRPGINSPALVCALIPDFSETPVMMSTGEPKTWMGGLARGFTRGYVREVRPSTKWYAKPPAGVRCLGWGKDHFAGLLQLLEDGPEPTCPTTDSGPRNDDAMDEFIEQHLWLTRLTGGAIAGFAGYDPRSEASLPRLQRFVLTGEVRKREIRGLVGIKCYPRCGWTVRRNKRLYGERGEALDSAVDKMVSWACSHDIPITSHHSPGGWPAVDQLLPPSGVKELFTDPQMPSTTGAPGSSLWLAGLAAAETAAQCAYVNETAAPNLWQPALARHSKLRLNIAHAGTAAAAAIAGSPGISGVPSSFLEYLTQWPVAAGAAHFKALFAAAVAVRVETLLREFRLSPVVDISCRTCPLDFGPHPVRREIVRKVLFQGPAVPFRRAAFFGR